MDIYALLIAGVIIVPDERDVTRIHGLLLGPAAKPPLVKFLTINEGQERFAPNPNEDGMISLSLLGTWSGPMWNFSEHSLRTVLIALQSIVTDDPYHNVPALVRGRPDEGGAYNDYLLHETLRVTVCDEVEDALDPGSSYSPELRKFVLMTFLKFYKAHMRTVRLQMRRIVREVSDPIGRVRTTRCDYDFILIRLELLNENVLELSESTSSDRAVD
nr:ubiquitin-conjugating enzyme E2 Z-like [Rhipicephalus microplus]